MQQAYTMLSESLRAQSVEGLYLLLVRAAMPGDIRPTEWPDDTPGGDDRNATSTEAGVSAP